MKTTLACLLAALAMLNAAASPPTRRRIRTNAQPGRRMACALPKDETMIDIFRPIAFGTALLHEEWKNGEQLTATVFYVVGSELRADHYCDMGNQLRYVDESKDPQVLRFVLRDASNLDTHPHHFHSTTWRYVDAEHHVQDWERSSRQAAEDDPHGFQARRRRKIDPQAVVRADVQALNDGNAPVLLRCSRRMRASSARRRIPIA